MAEHHESLVIIDAIDKQVAALYGAEIFVNGIDSSNVETLLIPPLSYDNLDKNKLEDISIPFMVNLAIKGDNSNQRSPYYLVGGFDTQNGKMFETKIIKQNGPFSFGNVEIVDKPEDF